MKEKFFNELAEALEMDADQIKVEDTFREYDNYDSLTELSILAMLDSEFDVAIEMPQYNECKTVHDLLNLVTSYS